MVSIFNNGFLIFNEIDIIENNVDVYNEECISILVSMSVIEV